MRSMIFIDGNNLMQGWVDYCKKNGHIKIDPNTNKEVITKKISYKKLITEITSGTNFIRGYFFDAVPEPLDGKKSKFFDMLRMNEITIITKKLKFKTIKCKHCQKEDCNIPHQKGVDVSLATELMGLAFENAYDLAIIISGDNDFVDAIRYIKSKGKKVKVVSFMSCLGQDTMREADNVIRLDKKFHDIVLLQ